MSKLESANVPNPLEYVVEDLMPLFTSTGDFMCRIDAQIAIARAVKAKLCTKGTVLELTGPISIFHAGLGRRATFDFHAVAELDGRWIIDVAQVPGGRVFDNLQDYKRRAIKP